MENRHFASIGEDISLLGYGCMRFPTRKSDGMIAVRESRRLLERAHEAGVNYFDTAWNYHKGESEPFLGQILSKWDRKSFHLATKLPTWLAKSPSDAEDIFTRQLQRCRVDYFDFYLAHSLTAEHYATFQASGAYQVLSHEKARGRIRRLGFSFHDRPELLERILDDHQWDFVQLQLNYLDWDLQDAKRQYEIVTQRGLPVIVMEPVRGGALASLTPAARAVLEEAAPGRSAASWALRYAASLPGVMTVLSGMSAMDQVEDNIASMSPFQPLSEEERAVLARAVEVYRSAGTIPCTGCRYCTDCPRHVDIPRIFAIYNQFCVDGKKSSFDNTWDLIPESMRPEQCVRCGQCVDRCPQHIVIPDRLAEVAAAAAEAAKG